MIPPSTTPSSVPSGAAAWNAPSTVARLPAGNTADSSAPAAGPYPASPAPTTARAARSCAKFCANPPASVARLHVVPIAAMALTRPRRSASSAVGNAPNATATETMDTSAPSCVSESRHSAFRYGNAATTSCRSMKSTVISAQAIPVTVQA